MDDLTPQEEDLIEAIDMLAEAYLDWEVSDPDRVERRYWAWVRRLVKMRANSIRAQDAAANEP